MPDANGKPLIDVTKHPDWIHALQLFQMINGFILQLQRQAGVRVDAPDMIKVAALTVALAESGHHAVADWTADLAIAKELTGELGRHVAMNQKCSCGRPNCPHIRPAV